MTCYLRLLVVFILSFIMNSGPSSFSYAREVNVYSYRQPQLVAPLFERFTRETDIKVNTIFASDGLIERMDAEGRNSPADVLLTTDISRLARAVRLGITRPVDSRLLKTNIPEQFRGENGEWFALSMRARVVYASRDRVKQDSITYAELADPKWRGRICTRSGQHDYSLGLIASIIAHEGVEKAEAWLEGVRQNLARKPTGNDRSQIKNIFAGECDIALGNTYYMGLMETNDKDPEQKKWAKAVKILFPDAKGRGTHVNVSGMIMARNAPHPDEALELMEFLSGSVAQRIYAEVNFEYPIKPAVPISPLVQRWGVLHPDSLPLDQIAGNRKIASELVDRVSFDDGPN